MTESDQLEILKRGLEKFRELGTVYEYPEWWKCADMGGPPEMSNYEAVDLGDIVDEILRDANL